MIILIILSLLYEEQTSSLIRLIQSLHHRKEKLNLFWFNKLGIRTLSNILSYFYKSFSKFGRIRELLLEQSWEESDSFLECVTVFSIASKLCHKLHSSTLFIFK